MLKGPSHANYSCYPPNSKSNYSSLHCIYVICFVFLVLITIVTLHFTTAVIAEPKFQYNCSTVHVFNSSTFQYTYKIPVHFKYVLKFQYAVGTQYCGTPGYACDVNYTLHDYQIIGKPIHEVIFEIRRGLKSYGS